MRIMHSRVSTKEQNLARQTELAKTEGFDKVYSDKASGKNASRPALREMLDNIRQGDTVTVLSIDRLGRNLKDVIEIVERIKEKGCTFECLSPKFDTDSIFGDFFISLLASLAQMEREQILERQRQGIRYARLMGKYKGRKRKQLEDFESIYKQWLANMITSEQAGKPLDVSRSTFYRRVKEYQENEIIDLSDTDENDNITK